MAESVGQIGLDLVVNRNGFDKQMNSITSLAKKAAGTLAGVFAIKGLINFGKQCLDLGSDLAEVQNVVDVTFSSMTKQVDDFAKGAAMNFGLSETMTKKYVGTFGAMSKAFGFNEKAAYDMSTALTGLSGDVASFYNTSQDEAYTKLKSVFTGETESLKDLGVVMTQTALDQFALSNGFNKVTKDMTEQEKVALRFAFVQQQLALASGDFSRTSDSWANQTRILKLQFDSLKASLGQGFIAILTPVVKVINTIMGKLIQLANVFKSFVEGITGKKADNPATSMQQVASAATSASGATDNIAKSTGKAAKKAKQLQKALMGFDEINTITKPTTDDSSGDIGGGAVGGGITDIPVNVVPKLDTSSMDGVMGGFMGELQKWFKSIDFAPLVNSFDRLKKSVEPIVNTIGQALKWFLTDILGPLAKWTIEDALPAFFNLLAGAMDFLNPILESFLRSADLLWDNFLGPIASWTGGIIVDVLNWIADALTSIGNWMSENTTIVDAITLAIESFGVALGIVKLVIGGWNLICGIATGVTTAFGAAVAFLTSPIGLVTLAIGAVIAIGVLLVKHWDEVKVIAGAVWEGIKNTISAIVNTIKNVIIAVWNAIKNITSTVFNTIKSVICGIWNGISTVTSSAWNGIKNTISGAINIVKTVVTTGLNAVKFVFSSVFSGIWNIVKGVVNSIIGGINIMVNGVISGINLMIRALNKLSFNVPEWIPVIGGKKFGFNLSEMAKVNIPKLATGGYVKANQPQLAMIGDNKTQGEIVAPEGKMMEVMTQALGAFFSKMEGQGNSNNSGGDLTVELYMDSNKMGDVIIKSFRKLEKKTGKVLLPI
ncbi:hypothetical protein SAMN02745248_02400 [Hathewaya proteolytica DSM 3090]|uniref:Phage-related protein n=1 Tax=Hathewaya proteolytica DSM 3090 TaxID=1121331 RepID=A0A1M6RZ37_9CLOT|nr:hypothetical protein [Hathewaya proteolytica]SHK37774.1 hypothetical protein SAMN02745248_02400 [Hathewaya proteolytica DSM 3090]